MASNNHIAILMCTHNGARFIERQLDSIAAQYHDNWSLHIADDNSEDETIELVERFCLQNTSNSVRIYDGPQTGFCDNFLTLMRNTDIQADYFAFCDQDDIWLPQKLCHSVQKLRETGATLYGGRTILIDETDSKIGLSPLFKYPPSIKNALIQSFAGGNTMLVTQEGIEQFRRAPKVEVVSHDWWIYLLLSASGLRVYYDAEPMVRYRQHCSNKVGSNMGLAAKYQRMRRLMRAEFKAWNQLHLDALNAYDEILSDEGRALCAEFATLRNLRGLKALNKLSEMGLYRQTRSGQIALRIAAYAGKV